MPNLNVEQSLLGRQLAIKQSVHVFDVLLSINVPTLALPWHTLPWSVRGGIRWTATIFWMWELSCSTSTISARRAGLMFTQMASLRTPFTSMTQGQCAADRISKPFQVSVRTTAVTCPGTQGAARSQTSALRGLNEVNNPFGFNYHPE